MKYWMSEYPISLSDVAGTGRKLPSIAIRSVNYGEAEWIARALNGELPSKEVFDALGDTKLANYNEPVWSWTTELEGAKRVLRGGGWRVGNQGNLTAAG